MERDAAVAEEQQFLDTALIRFDELADQLRTEADEASIDDTGPARATPGRHRRR